MLDIKKIRENADDVRRGIESRGADPAQIDQVLDLDGKRRALLTEVETLKGKRNTVSKEIGRLKKQGEDTADIQAEMKALGADVSRLDAEVREADAFLADLLLRIPNVPHASTPVGADESANQLVREVGERVTFDFEPKGHVELGETLGILDLPRATRMSGSGFPLLVGHGARLQLALIRGHAQVKVVNAVFHSPLSFGE